MKSSRGPSRSQWIQGRSSGTRPLGLASASSGKAQLVLTVSKSVTSRVRAGDAIRRIAQLVGGSGGGRPDMAEAGGSEPARLDEAIEAVYQTVQELLAPAPGPSPSA